MSDGDNSDNLAGECPGDKGKVVFIIYQLKFFHIYHFLYGLAILLPFNILIACLDFYEDKMPGYYPQSTYPFALQFLLFFGSLFFTVFQERWFTSHTMIIWGYGIQVVLLAILPFLANIGGTVGYWTMFATLIVLGWFLGVVQGCCYYENSKLPGEYIGIFLTAQGLAGIASNVLRFASLEIWADEPFASTCFCYSFSLLVCLLCIPAQLAMKRNAFARYYNSQSDYKQVVEEVDGDELVDPTTVRLNNMDTTEPIQSTLQSPSIDGSQSSWSNFVKMTKKTLGETNGLIMALFWTFVITFVVFPAVVQDTNLSFMDSWENEDSWFILTTLTLFNVCDTIGRYMAGLTCSQLSQKATVILNYLRVVFIGTFLLTAFEVGPAWLFCSDWFKLTNIILFAISNGWFSSLCAIYAPDCVSQESRGDAGSLINPAIVGGILLGSIFAIPMEQLIKLTPKAKAATS